MLRNYENAAEFSRIACKKRWAKYHNSLDYE